MTRLGPALAAAAAATTAQAQDADVSSAVDSIESRNTEAPRRVSPRFEPEPDETGVIVTASPDQSRFEFKFNAATSIATNPARREGGSGDAARILPTLALSFADATGELGYGVELNATTEGFAGGEGKDTSILGAKASASLWDRTERFSVVDAYAPKLVYSGILVSRDVTFQVLRGGSRHASATRPLAAERLSRSEMYHRYRSGRQEKVHDDLMRAYLQFAEPGGLRPANGAIDPSQLMMEMSDRHGQDGAPCTTRADTQHWETAIKLAHNATDRQT